MEKFDKIVNLMKSWNNNTKCVVRIQDLSDSFKVDKRLRQGNALSPMLFNLALESVIRRMSQQQRMDINENYTVSQWAIQSKIL